MRRDGPHAISLKEQSRPLSAVYTVSPSVATESPSGVSRSRSFHGMPSTPGVSPITPTSPSAPWATPVLGEGYRMPLRARTLPSTTSTTGSSRKALKVPKAPRPARTTLILNSVKKGVRECIAATESDIIHLRTTEDLSTASSTGQARLLDIEKQIKAAERHKKRLEFHLAKIEEIEEQYMLHQQLREGAKTMAKAYSTLSGSNKKSSMHKVECGFKECTQVLCVLEAQLEALLGTFHFQMKGMDGFARMMPGDVYELTLRHGSHKWKSRGKIGHSLVGRNPQSWSPEVTVFKALIADVFNIKAVEVKGLGKHVLLGHKNCETKDLFSSHPQMMTVSINSTGSLKLAAAITWNPLDGVDDSTMSTEALHPGHMHPARRRPHSYVGSPSCHTDFPHPAFINGGEPTSSDYSSDHSALSTPSFSSKSNRHSFPSPLQAYALPDPRSHSNVYGHVQRPNSIAVMDTINESGGAASLKDSGQITKPKLFDMRLLSDSLDGDLHTRQEVMSLEEALQSLRTNLEDYQGRYPELQTLEEQVQYLDAMLKRNSRETSPHTGLMSEVSVSIENALGAFDFLEQEDYLTEGYGSANNSRRTSLDALEAKCTLSPESTTKTADSGIESIANRLHEDHAHDSSLGSLSPELPSTGNEQVDVALLWHLQYCEKLLENLGNFGPLKCKEIYSLDKLQKQAAIIERLIGLARAGSQVKDLQQVMSEATKRKELRQFWVRCVDQTVLYVNAERCMAQLERSFGDMIRDKYDISASKVFRTLVARVLDIAHYDPEHHRGNPHLTMHQFMLYFSQQPSSTTLQEYLENLAGELWVTERLRSGNTDITIKTLLSFRDTVPPASALRIISLLLMVDNMEIRHAAANYLKGLRMKSSARDKVLVVYVEGLEDQSADVRCAACTALRVIQGAEAMEQLVYVSQSDRSGVVKQRAREAVLSLGEEGQKALEQSELTSHGFQGVTVKL